MMILILTHDAFIYSIVSLLLISLSSSNISNYFFSRFLKNSSINTITIYACVQVALVVWWMIVIDIGQLFSGSFLQEILALPVGIALGLLYIFLEKWCIKRYVRQASPSRETKRSPATISRIYSYKLIGKKDGAESLVRNDNTSYIKVLQSCSFIALLIIAVCEEIIFRGFLVNIALHTSSYISMWGLFMIFAFFFGLSHIFVGWMQVGLKMVFGILALGSYLFTGTIIAPILMHILLNSFAYREIKRSRALRSVNVVFNSNRF